MHKNIYVSISIKLFYENKVVEMYQAKGHRYPYGSCYI